VISTTQLLLDIYNGTTELKSIEAENLRKKIQTEIEAFNSILHEYYYESNLTNEDKQLIRTKLKRKLSKASPFTSFKIWILKSNNEIYEEFKDLI